MFLILMQMTILVMAGMVWQRLAPQHIPVLAHRRALTDLVFFILLPALVLDVIWQAPLNLTSMKVSASAYAGLAIGALAMWLVLTKFKTTPAQKGALMLAATFPNATYLGLPVLNQLMGQWSTTVVIQYDLFACTPVLLTLGILMAHHYGASKSKVHPLRELLRVPPLWAVVIGMSLNLLSIPQPEIVHGSLTLLSGGVVPLMLIALGMSIRWDTVRLRYLPLLLPVAVITLMLVPLAVYVVSHIWFDMPRDVGTAVVLLAAMPTMIFGLVICERYQLDTPLYAAAITLTTLLSIITLTGWSHFLPMM